MDPQIKIPLITNIQRYSLDDGPGIRTVIFMKGCPLHCPWCHNPENISPKMGLYFHEDKCERCERCAAVCPEKAITLPGADGSPPIRDRDKCTQCMQCALACPAGALEQVGEVLTIEEIIREAISDMPFYRKSGGGVTISGGEPLLFPEFTLELAQELKKKVIHVAVETSGFGSWEHLSQIATYADMFLYDIKHMNSLKHQAFVGVPNNIIHDNLRKLVKLGKKVIVRVPVIPGFNNEKHNFEMMAEFLRTLDGPVQAVDLLPFHNFGEAKYKQLDKDYNYKGRPNMEKEEVVQFSEILQNVIRTTIGGVTIQ
ncbi:glycyl-radical enzyme activating protein [Desulfoscipio gibsoniae]|uniref:Glycyl-radical enzyme activator family protein n=1 Tax=Desulfoscipio gibsoniae DSM 7213 TaxID=767817 RepID=R4KAI9_9FIRM|nr:glycyl-radical enzyme activating protein [Desulfoscipio gibsoniae]AGL00208.1 glycyl-radical enzyme activator family protein [Desulfoscipio gibsoniae DSM 7213]